MRICVRSCLRRGLGCAPLHTRTRSGLRRSAAACASEADRPAHPFRSADMRLPQSLLAR